MKSRIRWNALSARWDLPPQQLCVTISSYLISIRWMKVSWSSTEDSWQPTCCRHRQVLVNRPEQQLKRGLGQNKWGESNDPRRVLAITSAYYHFRYLCWKLSHVKQAGVLSTIRIGWMSWKTWISPSHFFLPTCSKSLTFEMRSENVLHSVFLVPATCVITALHPGVV